ncbi:N-acyl-phosphatidylethanolamine-hydrolyzing phospholipase [Pseudoneurospora amorphoporcata]|uniref:N-acyl-phosphatidylethanolamine-hydrolyzing phospholipase n=1 Tax=Pseudoneurospora amorphoporcata TaxID=241081 RepID=A0AAN6NVV3_9PEZI|nr:N-acyl-phosphatidylethanolamine-hydrolyzing phospholipase [Pseudoneurospora amorphoporcata]
MDKSTRSEPLQLHVNRETQRESATPPHHVLPTRAFPARLKPNSEWSSYLSYLPSWDPSPGKTRPTSNAETKTVAGFRNPWPSWYTPPRSQVWDHLSWGEDQYPCVDLAASHLPDAPDTNKLPEKSKRPRFSDVNNWPDSDGAKAAQLLRIESPDFSFDRSTSPHAKVTWLGHAGVLVQLPPLDATKGSRPIRCLFDPIFSMRCSPSQRAGPIRAYPPPCRVQDLPPVDAVFISHNHFDHLDYDTIMAIWESSKETVRFLVPLGNRSWFVDCGISEERVTEMDWWDSATLSSHQGEESSAILSLRIWCTPAQHSSGRGGNDANSTLWSSWYLCCQDPDGGTYRIFFAGDTGYQFHGSPDWPPGPPSGKNTQKPNTKESDDTDHPPCPAFAEIRDRLGPPNLLLLPVAVGSTYSYLRSFVPLPDWISPFPRHSAGITAGIHMPPWDAVRVFKLMIELPDKGTASEGTGGSSDSEKFSTPHPPMAIAMHWGTFVTEGVEVLKTLGQLEWACQQQEVHFARSLPVPNKEGETQKLGGRASKEGPAFVAMNHGQSLAT